MEKTFVCVKPDGVQRGLIGEVVKRFENRGLILCAAKFMQVTPELAAKHYAEHEGKPFYNGLINYITAGPVFAMVCVPTVVAPDIDSAPAISRSTVAEVASSPNLVTCTVATAPSNAIEETESVAPGPCAPSVVNSTVSE